MKELYISPEVQVLCFAPVEGLASNVIDFGALLQQSGGNAGGGTEGASGDVALPIG